MLGIQAPPSRRTSKVAAPSFELKVKVAPVWFVIEAGLESTVVCGRVRSTVTVSVSLVVLRALSVAMTLSVQEPSAGIARETE